MKTENVYAKTEVCKHGKRQRGPSFKPNCKITSSAMRRKKWCPVANCTAVVSYLDKHLRNVHNMKRDSVQYRVLLKSATAYSGTTEVDLLVDIQEVSVEDTGVEPEAAAVEAPEPAKV